MKRAIIVACLTGAVIATGALAADDSTNAPPPRPMRPMMGNLLRPRILEDLALTADQQTKYNSLDASFKSDVAKLQANNAPPGGPTTNAPPSGGREAFRALHRSYIEKLRAFLTADQNAKLTQALENGPGGGRRGAGPGAGGNPPPPPQPPPPQNN
jgi:Spy/CpxP family protein refolding chaperone